MQYDEFVEQVRRRAGLEQRDPAWDLTCRTLEVLAEALDADEADHLATQLPDALQGCLGGGDRGGDAGAIDLDAFRLRVIDAVGHDIPEGEIDTQVGAVLSTLRDAVSDQDWARVAGQLPPGYTELAA